MAVRTAANVREKAQVNRGNPMEGPVEESWAIPGEGNLLDDTNRAIIESLQRDGRRAYAQIASEVGLSEAAVRRRVQQLRTSGVIQIVAVPHPLPIGFPPQAPVGVR